VPDQRAGRIRPRDDHDASHLVEPVCRKHDAVRCGTIVERGTGRHLRCDGPAGAHSLGLKSDGSIVAWGRTDEGQCTVPAPNANFAAVAAGSSHSLGLRSPLAVGACCQYLACEIFTPQNCATHGGSYQGNGTLCAPNPCPTSGVGESGPATAVALRISSNPFAGSTTLYVAGPSSSTARVVVFDATGRLVRRAWEGGLDGREVAVTWDGKDESGHAVPAGIYLARVESTAGQALGRLVKTR
jgi:hypothetical protein